MINPQPTHTVTISQGRGRPNQYGLNRTQRDEMAAALRTWTLSESADPLAMLIPGGGRVTVHSAKQAVRLFWNLTGGGFLLSDPSEPLAHVSERFLHKMGA